MARPPVQSPTAPETLSGYRPEPELTTPIDEGEWQGSLLLQVVSQAPRRQLGIMDTMNIAGPRELSGADSKEFAEVTAGNQDERSRRKAVGGG